MNENEVTFQLGEHQQLEYMNVYQIESEGEGYDLVVSAEKDIILALSGRGVLSLDGGTQPVHAGQRIEIATGNSYRLVSSGSETLVVQVLGLKSLT